MSRSEIDDGESRVGDALARILMALEGVERALHPWILAIVLENTVIRDGRGALSEFLRLLSRQPDVEILLLERRQAKEKAMKKSLVGKVKGARKLDKGGDLPKGGGVGGQGGIFVKAKKKKK